MSSISKILELEPRNMRDALYIAAIRELVAENK